MKSSYLSPEMHMSNLLSPKNSAENPMKKMQKKMQQNYKVQAQQLSSLKQRIKLRSYNKENINMYKSQFVSPIKNLQLSIQKPQPIIKKHQISTLSLDEFEIGDLLGKGAQSKVKFAVHKKTGFMVSIKSILRQKIESKMDVFIRAMKIQMYLDHPNIAKIYGIVVDEKYVHLIIQYCMDGDLSRNMKQFGKEDKGTKCLLYKIGKAMEYLHTERIHHRDLKLQNILMNLGVPKITDFQLSVYTKLPFLQRKTLCGSPAYFSPEMVQKHRYNKKADIWCLGILFFELLCGYFPFQINNFDDVNNIQSKQLKLFPKTVSNQAIQLITKMLDKDSDNRISIDEVLQHKFFMPTEENT